MQGQSASTRYKEDGFARLFRENLAVFRGMRNPPPIYFHFDLTAGSGMNNDGVRGSPLVWRDSATAAQAESWRAWFVEVHPARAATLASRPEMGDPRCTVEAVDHRQFLPRIPDLIAAAGVSPAQAIGTVLADPNGHQGMPLDELAALSRQCPRLDLVLHWCSAGMKRWLGWSERHGLPAGMKLIRLNAALDLLHKPYWLIRQPRDFWQWSILFGTGYQRKKYPRLGFYDIRSQAGIAILDKLSHTEKERNGKVQGCLF